MTREALPREWAMTQNILAMAYIERIRGDRADNLEQAIKLCEMALSISTGDAVPSEWAATQNNLAKAYADRIRGERADNLEQAIKLYQETLTGDARGPSGKLGKDAEKSRGGLSRAHSRRSRRQPRASDWSERGGPYRLPNAVLVTRARDWPASWPPFLGRG